MLFRSRNVAFILTLFLFILAACGSNGSSSSESSSPSQSNASPSAAASASPSPSPEASPEVKTVKDVLGDVEIKGVPKRIVALDWVYVEDVLAVGVQPVGVAEIENYNRWVKVKVDLGPDVQEVGTRFEPNLEQIAALKPDLIIGIQYRHEKIVDQLNAIAPTLIFNPYSEQAAQDPYKEMEETFLTIAEVLDKKDEGQQVLDNLNEVYAKAKEQLAASNKAGTNYVLTQAFTVQNAASFRLFTDNSIPVQILSKLGMTNNWKSDKLEMYGMSETTIESLPKVQDASLLTIIQSDDDVIALHMKDNTVWKSLTFVKENRIFALGGDTWPFGGPLSAETLTERIVSVLSK